MANKCTQKQALGRTSHLGYLYDERSDSFLRFSIFNCEINPSALKKTHTPFTDISYLICGSTSQKLLKLSVDAQLKISVLTGLTLLEGSSSKYLQIHDKSLKSYSADLFYNMTTVYEEVDIAKLSEDEINKKCLQSEATHVVVGIKWGANVIGSFDYEAKEGETKQDIVG